MQAVKSIGFSLLDPQEGRHIEAFDYTKLTSINTCPTWGITRYGMHKRMPTLYDDARSMPLEAGQALHEAFAGVRICQLWYTRPDHAMYHGTRIFGRDRWTHLQAVIRNAGAIDTAIRHMGMEALATSGFTDSPYDKRRTLSNLEGSIAAYTAGYDYERWPVWVASERNPSEPVGVELPFNILVSTLGHDGSEREFRLTGKIDGIHWHREPGTELMVHENKSGGRLDDAWAQAFDMSHQVTGYCVAGSLLCGHPIGRAVVRGVQLPLPRLVLNGLRDLWVVREAHHRVRWIDWMMHTLYVYDQYKGDPMSAPKYTHSCNRYFRPCPMIPFCVADPGEQEQILSEMVKDEWSPLAEEYDA